MGPFRLINADVRRRAIEAIRVAPEGWVVRISEPRRSLDQNALFHGWCGALQRSDLMWANTRRHKDEWKTLLVSGHSIVTGVDPELVTGLEGELVTMRESTARMGKSRSSSLIDYTQAFCASHGVVWTFGKQPEEA